ncbi:MAG: hypothetical protein NTZ10_03825 [Candidatus Saganbacteria bacterium]|nr:hypothetical protein [Candidatus Saganbacteria bacterium]
MVSGISSSMLQNNVKLKEEELVHKKQNSNVPNKTIGGMIKPEQSKSIK